jgi:sugar O-acyltransferase (sialic acid O-acetyltransferase NeuD family)
MTKLFFSEYEVDSDFEQVASRQPIAILGAGGLGREVALLLAQLNAAGAAWDIRGFYDDQTPDTPTVAGLPYLGTSADLNASTTPLAVAVAVGSSASRAAAVGRLSSALLSFPKLVHPSAQLTTQQRVAVGDGCIIQPNCVLTCDIQLGRFVLLSPGCTVGHDAVLDDFCSLMPQASVGGAARLATGVYIGAHATVIQGVTIDEAAVIGAGAVAVRNIPARVTAVGVPARVLAPKAT